MFNAQLTNHEGIVSTRYVGPLPRLQEQAALVRSTTEPAVVEAKFNNERTMMSNGWHKLPRTDFAMWAPKV